MVRVNIAQRKDGRFAYSAHRVGTAQRIMGARASRQEAWLAVQDAAARILGA